MKSFKRKKLYLIIFVCLLSILAVSPLIANAGNAFFQDVKLGNYGLVPDDCADSLPDCKNENVARTSTCSTCGFEDFVVLGVNIANIILGISGSIALLFFVYGGILWIISSGSSTMVDKGRKAIISSVIGLAIIFSSWMIINFTIATLTSQDPWKAIEGGTTVLDKPWYKPF